jgi:hypothetical protein
MYESKNHSTQFKFFTLNSIDSPDTLPKLLQLFDESSMKISKSFDGELSPGINESIMKFDSSMHTHGGLLYGTKNTGHILYELFMLPNGLKPSVARPSLRFLASFANSFQLLLNYYHASPSVGWLSSFSLIFTLIRAIVYPLLFLMKETSSSAWKSAECLNTF